MSKVYSEHDVVYVVGHRHPDSDSICSAIAYAELKKKLGYNAIACRLGDTFSISPAMLTYRTK